MKKGPEEIKAADEDDSVTYLAARVMQSTKCTAVIQSIDAIEWGCTTPLNVTSVTGMSQVYSHQKVLTHGLAGSVGLTKDLPFSAVLLYFLGLLNDFLH
jgi:hypothetical protein